MKFLGNVLAVIVGIFVFTILSILLFFGLIGIIAASGEKEVSLDDNTVLHLNLNGRVLVERTSEDDLNFGQFGNPFGGSMQAGMINLKKAIRERSKN